MPEPDGTIGDCHDADITPGTIIPSWYGERLNLDYAIGVCFANADVRSGPPPDDEPEPPAHAGDFTELADAINHIRERLAAKAAGAAAGRQGLASAKVMSTD